MENQTIQEKPIKNKPIFVWIASLSIPAVIAAGVFFFFEHATVKKEIATFNEQSEQIQKEIDKIDIQKLQATQNAQSILNVIEEDEILWSDVISKVQDLNPLDEDGDEKIIISSYSGGDDGSINISATSRPDRGSSTASLVFEDIAEMISVFNQSNIFKNGFVPAISKGLTEEGNIILSFSFSADYSPTNIKRN